jgi:hypothetical protein
MKTIKDLADICQDRAMNYAPLEGRPNNQPMFDKWQKLSDHLKQVNLCFDSLDAEEAVALIEILNYEVGRRLLPLEGYSFHLWQGNCSRLWYWYIRSEQYGQILTQNSDGFVEEDDCKHNLDLVRRAFNEEAAKSQAGQAKG